MQDGPRPKVCANDANLSIAFRSPYTCPRKMIPRKGGGGMVYKCAEDGCGALFGKWMACLGHCKALNHAGWPNSAGKMKKRCTITSQARMRKREIEVLVVFMYLSLCSFLSICPPPHPPPLLENIWGRCERSRISVDHSAASANVVYFVCVCVCATSANVVGHTAEESWLNEPESLGPKPPPLFFEKTSQYSVATKRILGGHGGRRVRLGNPS